MAASAWHSYNWEEWRFMLDTDVPVRGAPMPTPERSPTETARIASELMDMARVVCAHTRDSRGRQLKLTDYLDKLLRGPITREHTAVLKKIKDDC
jgi:hypothetical protein